MRQKRNAEIVIIHGVVCVLLCLALSGCTKESQKSSVSVPPAKDILATTTILAAMAGQGGQTGNAAQSQHGAGEQIVFSELGRGVAYLQRKADRYQVVHDGKTGAPYAEIQWLALSPDGARAAYSARTDEHWSMIIDGRQGKLYDEVGMAVFSPDGKHVVYDAREQDRWHLVLDEEIVIACPQNYKYYDKYFDQSSSAIITIESPIENGSSIWVIERDLALKATRKSELHGVFVDKVFNRDRSKLALVRDNRGKRAVVTFSLNTFAAIAEGPSFEDIIYLTFVPDGEYVAYIGALSGKRYIVLNDRKELIPDGVLRDPPAIRPDKKGASLIIDDESGEGFFFYEAFFPTGDIHKRYQEAAGVLYNPRSGQPAYIARKDEKIFMVVNGKEGPSYDMIVTPMFSPDGKYLIYRARKDGKRFVVVADEFGKTIRQHRAYEQVFPPVLTADGKTIAYGVKDGTKLIWMVEKL